MLRVSVFSACLFLLIVILPPHLFAYGDRSFITIGDSRETVPQSLLTIITVDLSDISFEEALQVISEEGDFDLSYNRDRIPVEQMVSLRKESVPALEALQQLLDVTNTELVVSGEDRFAVVPQNGQPTGKIKGKVVDGETKIPLVNVNVSLAGSEKGAATDETGWFLLEDVPVGSYAVQLSFIGYKTITHTDVIVRSKRITFVDAELCVSPVEMDQIVVTGGYFSKGGNQPTSVINYSSEEIRRAAAVMGDVSRIVTGLASVAKVNDSFNSLVVRGGSTTENAFFIDNIEVPNISHFAVQGTSGGFLSAFNVDLVRDVTFYSGGFSAAYGDRLSSVMDLSFREGNRDEYDMQFDMHVAGIGGIAEGPLPDRKGSWLLAARHSFLDLVFDMAGEEGNIPRFTDYQTKLTYDLSAMHNISLLGVFWFDDLSSTRDDALNDGENEYGGLKWGHNTVGCNWRFLWGTEGYSNTSISYTSSRYDLNWFLTRDNSELFDNNSNERELKLRNVNHCRINPSHSLQFGIGAKHLSTSYDQYDAEYNDPLGNPTLESRINETIRSQKYSAFVSHQWSLSDRVSLSTGLRFDHFTHSDNSHISPRLSVSYRLNNTTSLNGSAGIFHQNLPLILLYQDDSFRNLPDPGCHHLVLGIDHLLTENTRLTAELYQKEYDHLPLDPTQPSLFILDQPIYQVMRFTPHENLESRGRSYARGVELSVQKKLAEKLYGLVSGTVFRSRYRGLDGIWRNRINDNQYAFNIDGGFKPNHKWEFSLRWTYAGGIPYTPFDIGASEELGRGVFDSTRVNAERLPDYHSLSVRLDRRFHFSGSNLTLYVSVWNVLNDRNTWYHLWNEVSNSPNTIKQLERTPIFGLEFEF